MIIFVANITNLELIIYYVNVFFTIIINIQIFFKLNIHKQYRIYFIEKST